MSKLLLPPYHFETHQPKILSPGSCAVGSFRTKKVKGRLLTFCCPKGQWQPRKKRCKVGMRLQSLGRPR